MSNKNRDKYIPLTAEEVAQRKKWLFEERNISPTDKFITISQGSDFIFWEICRNLLKKKLNEETN